MFTRGGHLGGGVLQRPVPVLQVPEPGGGIRGGAAGRRRPPRPCRGRRQVRGWDWQPPCGLASLHTPRFRALRRSFALFLLSISLFRSALSLLVHFGFMFAVLFPSALLDYLLSSRIYYQLVEGNGIKGYPWVAAFYKGEKVRARFLKYMYICICGPTQ